MNQDENKRANLLCIISILCELAPIVSGVLNAALLATTHDSALEPMMVRVTSAISALSGLGFIAGIVVLIIVRVKYPQNTFGKVLMWVYIVLGILGFLAFVAILVVCAAACGQGLDGCASCLESCRHMGWMR